MWAMARVKAGRKGMPTFGNVGELYPRFSRLPGTPPKALLTFTVRCGMKVEPSAGICNSTFDGMGLGLRAVTLHPGDVLYLPPGMAHHGVALDSDCITWSVGFRAPDYRDLLAEMVAETLADTDEQLYTDPGRAPVDDAGELSAADRDAMLDRAFGLLDRGAAGRARRLGMVGRPARSVV